MNNFERLQKKILPDTFLWYTVTNRYVNLPDTESVLKSALEFLGEGDLVSRIPFSVDRSPITQEMILGRLKDHGVCQFGVDQKWAGIETSDHFLESVQKEWLERTTFAREAADGDGLYTVMGSTIRVTYPDGGEDFFPMDASAFPDKRWVRKNNGTWHRVLYNDPSRRETVTVCGKRHDAFFCSYAQQESPKACKKCVAHQDSVEAKFSVLSKIWYKDSGGLSVVESDHPAYLAVIRLGNDVVPYLLREIANRKGWWFAALRSITQESPNTPEMSGKYDLLAKAWLDWAERKIVK